MQLILFNLDDCMHQQMEGLLGLEAKMCIYLFICIYLFVYWLIDFRILISTRLNDYNDVVTVVTYHIKTLQFLLLPKGKGRDAGPSSSGKQKKQHLRGDWVRGHQKDGGIYAREMPQRITGKFK